MPTTFRPLPPRPSLEYARKEAKALLRRLRTGNAETIALARSRHPQIDHRDPSSIRLADAQLVLARDHGFASWPQLVRYIGDVERQQHGHHQLHFGPDAFEHEARRLLAEHRARLSHAGRQIAGYVPRFYGLSLDEVYENAVTDDEARLAVARGHGAPSWEVLVERLEHNARTRPGQWETDPMQDAREAIKASDLGALQRVAEAHPELLHPSDDDISAGRTLMGVALWQERKRGAAVMRSIVEWLEAQGFDRQLELNRRLCGEGYIDDEKVRALLEQGADPNWVAPNGIPVLEHALLRYWKRSEGGVDLLMAAGARPRRALWIAAGIGDVDGVRGFLDARGRPTPAARRLRPDFVAMGRPMLPPPLPDADDEEILVEALFVAMLNRRTTVIEYLASRGAPLNSLVYGEPLVTFAVGNVMRAAVETLVRCGADLDLRCEQDFFGGDRTRTARELARDLPDICANGWESVEVLRIVELCGLDPVALRAERDARPLPEPVATGEIQRSLELAREDAARLGQREVGPENLLIGLLRAVGPFHRGMDVGRMDIERFRADLGDRIAPVAEGVGQPELPLQPEAEAAMDAAIELATEQRQEVFNHVHLLHALTRPEEGSVGRLLARYGVDVAKLHSALGTR